ncbi:hypothetical protein EMIHUDRAFT_210024 [Emiliania huxleyi CCMP1516]|uniref:Pherophorin domain-containing protein n=2 Tax=Emiliania huxleyi TaxID=2903 RepID=A0A0D3J1I1_EMIH1|nr:hypothetical protein EMIHUDRAFT_210024 [Emiliania huxleyi CCMP1516]EOD17366.1 hypothetical protein EMIHUDRAFT_210024 [Emiliania huxleyi CCMP1516]|eukprot:XP_005769795.1 hypothetical protein EMIHUDRAFT_210024 [Emiliania huxleyi CCMP1516]
MVARRVRPTVPEPAAIPISKRKELYVLAIFLWSLFLSGTFFAIGWVGNSINQNAAAMSPQSPPPASPPTAPPALLPLAVSNEKEWLIATSGICYDLTLAFAGGDVGPEAPGDTAAGFIAGIAFKYQPQTAVRFTDYPYHEANVINGSSETTALTSAMWSFKNIALLESNCSDVVGHSCSFGTIIFKVETHGVCTTSGSPCVEYTGNVSVATNSVEGLPLALRSFACQLFVDGASMKPGACSNFCQLIIQGGECSDENLFANDGVKVLPSNFVGFFRYKAPAGSYAPGAAVAVGAGGAVWAGMQADILGNLAGLAQNFMVGILNFVWGFSKGPISRVVWTRLQVSLHRQLAFGGG